MNGEAGNATGDKVSALRSALRSAPPKEEGRLRGSLKAAVTQVLPDLLAFRAKGYNDAELAAIMRDHGFVIAARTLKNYINEARAHSSLARKKKAATATKSMTATSKSGARAGHATQPMALRPSQLATKPLAQPRRAAKDVLGHRFDDDV